MASGKDIVEVMHENHCKGMENGDVLPPQI